MEQWGFIAAAFGITAVTLTGYALVLRTRLRAAENALKQSSLD